MSAVLWPFDHFILRNDKTVRKVTRENIKNNKTLKRCVTLPHCLQRFRYRTFIDSGRLAWCTRAGFTAQSVNDTARNVNVTARNVSNSVTSVTARNGEKRRKQSKKLSLLPHIRLCTPAYTPVYTPPPHVHHPHHARPVLARRQCQCAHSRLRAVITGCPR